MRDRWFWLNRRCHAGVPALLAGLSFAVYLATLAPGLTWAHQGADGGDLIAASYTLGIAHPPGYPLYMLLGKLFSYLPLGSIAFRYNLMSATSAALTVSLLYIWLRSWLARALPQSPTWLRVAISAAAGLLLAFSRLFWSQALIAEVYALNALMVTLALYLTERWEATAGSARVLSLALCAFACGLGTGNHATMLLLWPPLFFYLATARPGPSRKETALAAVCAVAGLAIYLYLPLRATARPPLNWGDPATPDRFLWTVSAALYRHYVFALPWEMVPIRLAKWAGDLIWQYGPWGVSLGLMGLWTLANESRRLLVFTASIFLFYSAYAIGYDTADSFVYLIPAYIVWAFWIGRGAAYAFDLLGDGLASRLYRQRAAALLCVLPLLSLAWNWTALDLRHDRQAVDYLDAVLEALPPEAIVISASDPHTFALWYAQYAEGRRQDLLILDRDLLPYQWYRDTALARHEVHIPEETPDPSSWLMRFLDDNLPDSPIFLTDADDRLATHYRIEPVWPVYRLQPTQ